MPFTTLFALPSQEEQIRCLRNVAAHLDDGGWFVMEDWVPDPTRYRHHQGLAANQVIVMTEAGLRLYPVFARYAWPAELDAMAAGLVLVDRYADYDRRPFDASSPRHVALYRRSSGP